MARPARPWFRLYVEATSDRKLRRLTPAQRWLWVAVLAAARQSPISGALMVSESDEMNAHDLADIAGMSVRDVEKALPLFERAGMIERDHELDAWVVPKWSDRQYESDVSTVRTRKHRSKEPVGNVPTPFEGTPESERACATETEPPTPKGFDEFWSTYPAKKAKQAALKAWLKAIKLATPDEIIAGAARYRDAPDRKPDYTAHPASWLNAGRWDDEIGAAPRDDWMSLTLAPGPPRLVDYEERVVPDAIPMAEGAGNVRAIREGIR